MYRVVIVDDEVVIRGGLKNLIPWDELGMEIVLEAGSGFYALEYIRSNPVDILITDIRMEGMDGLTLIEHVKVLNKQMHCVILTGYDDFAYTKRAIGLGIDNYILKPVDEKELLETLINVGDMLYQEKLGENTIVQEKQVIMQSVLSRWLNGTIEVFALRHRAEFLKIPLDRGYVQACVLRAPQWQDAGSGAGAAKQRERLANALTDSWKSMEDVWMRVCCDFRRELVLVFSGELIKHADQIKTQLVDFIDHVKLKQHMQLYAAFGSVQNEPQLLSVSYEDARKNAELNLIFPDKLVIEHRKHSLGKSDNCIQAMDYRQLESAILESDKTVISKLYHDWIQQLLKSFPNMAMVKSYAAEMLCRLIVLRADNISNQNCFMSDRTVLEKLFGAKSFEQISMVLENYSLELAEQIKLKQYALHPSVRRLMANVERDYSKDLTLRSLAEQFNANSVYLGRLFKEETGQTFTMYLNSVRMREAKRLLAETDMTVADIASTIGYASIGYFVNQFKKMFSCSPREYRMKQK